MSRVDSRILGHFFLISFLREAFLCRPIFGNLQKRPHPVHTRNTLHNEPKRFYGRLYVTDAHYLSTLKYCNKKTIHHTSPHLFTGQVFLEPGLGQREQSGGAEESAPAGPLQM